MQPVVIVTGSHGFIGKPLVSALTHHGFIVKTLVRTPSRHSYEIFWNPDNNTLEPSALENAYALIHLAGENIAAKRWTKQQKEYLIKNRTDSAQLLSNALSQLNAPPAVVISASAIGYYPPSENLTTENSAAGSNYSSHLCQLMEGAWYVPEGTRLIQARFGVVLHPSGGALANMLPAFKLGIGGVIGKGTQPMSWITRTDCVHALLFLLQNLEIAGPVNITAPHPVDNATFTKTFANTLKRPALVPMPTALVKFLFGQMGQELLLEGAPVIPGKLIDSGFQFKYPHLPAALQFLLNAK